MSRPDLQGVADDLAAAIGRAVAIDSPDMGLLAHTAHAGPVDAQRIHTVLQRQASNDFVEHVGRFDVSSASGPVRIPAAPELELLSRVCVPVRHERSLLAYIFLIDDDYSLTDAQLELAVGAASVAAEVLKGEERDGTRALREAQGTIAQLIGGDPGLASRAVALAGADFPHLQAGPVGVIAARVAGGGTLRQPPPKLEQLLEIHATLTTRLWSGALGEALAAPLNDGTVLAILDARGSGDDVLRAAAMELHLGLRAGLDRSFNVAAGPVAGDVGSISLSHRGALAALNVCERLEEFGPVATWAEVGSWGLLAEACEPVLMPGAIPEGLAKLLATNGGDKLVETLETYLDLGGNAQLASKALFVHRASLYYRLNRVQELTDLSLASGDDRLTLQLGLRFARLTGIWRGGRVTPEPPAERATESARR